MKVPDNQCSTEHTNKSPIYRTTDVPLNLEMLQKFLKYFKLHVSVTWGVPTKKRLSNTGLNERTTKYIPTTIT